MFRLMNILIYISLRYDAMGSVYNKPFLDQIIYWQQQGDKPLLESMMT